MTFIYKFTFLLMFSSQFIFSNDTINENSIIINTKEKKLSLEELEDIKKEKQNKELEDDGFCTCNND